MHSVRRVEPSICNANARHLVNSSATGSCTLEGGVADCATVYLRGEVPENQHATGSGRAVGAPCGTSYGT